MRALGVLAAFIAFSPHLIGAPGIIAGPLCVLICLAVDTVNRRKIARVEREAYLRWISASY